MTKIQQKTLLAMILVILAFQKSRNFWFSQEKHCIIKKTNKQKDRLPE